MTQDTTAGIEQDVRLMVGGNFSADHIGPQAYDATLARARGKAKSYLEVFNSLYLGQNFDAVEQSSLYLPTFLKALHNNEPVLVRTIAQRLLKQYDAVMIVYDAVKDKHALFALLPEETTRLLMRLDVRRKELKELI